MFCRKVEAFDSRMHLSHHCGRLNGSFSEGVGSPGYMDKVQKSDTFMIDELTIVGSFFGRFLTLTYTNVIIATTLGDF